MVRTRFFSLRLACCSLQLTKSRLLEIAHCGLPVCVHGDGITRTPSGGEWSALTLPVDPMGSHCYNESQPSAVTKIEFL